MIDRRRFLVVASLVCAAPVDGRAQRTWEKGVWVEVKIQQPRMRVGVRTGDPNSPIPAMARVTETRDYVIETRTLRLEVRQNGTLETPRLAAVVGEPVSVSIERTRVLVRDEDGKEHALVLRKRTVRGDDRKRDDPR